MVRSKGVDATSRVRASMSRKRVLSMSLSSAFQKCSGWGPPSSIGGSADGSMVSIPSHAS